MSGVGGPPAKVKKYEMESQFLEGEVIDEGQEEWLSDGIVTDDDYNAEDHSQSYEVGQLVGEVTVEYGTPEPDSQESAGESQEYGEEYEYAAVEQECDTTESQENRSPEVSILQQFTITTGEISQTFTQNQLEVTQTSQDSVSRDSKTVDSASQDSKTLSQSNSAAANIEQTLNDFENARADSVTPDLPDDLDAYLIMRSAARSAAAAEAAAPPPAPASQANDDGNDTDDLLRMLGDDNKGKKKQLTRKTRRHKQSADDSDDDDYVYTGTKPAAKKIQAAKKALSRKPASKAVPEDSGGSENETLMAKQDPPALKVATISVVGGKAADIAPRIQQQKPTPLKSYVNKRAMNYTQQLVYNQQKPMNNQQQIVTTQQKIINSITPKSSRNSQQKLINTQKSVSNKQQNLINTRKNLNNSQEKLDIIQKSLDNSQIKLNDTQKILRSSQQKLINTQNTMIRQPQVIKTEQSISKIQQKIIKTGQNVNKIQQQVIKPELNMNKIQQQVIKPEQNINKIKQQVIKPEQRMNIKQQIIKAEQSMNKNQHRVYSSPKMAKSSKTLPETHAKVPDGKEVKKDVSKREKEDQVLEKSSVAKREPLPRDTLMKPEEMDEEVPSDEDSDSDSDHESLYDELPSSDTENDDWFTLDIRAERAGDYLPLLGEKAYDLLMEEKQRTETRLQSLKTSLTSLTESGRKQADEIRKATLKVAELDGLLKTT